MSSIAVGVIALAFGAVMLNFCAAGLVAGFYFWRNVRSVSKRAVLGALLTGLICVAMLSGALLQDIISSVRETVVVVSTIVMFLGLACASSFPGAFIMSRKIAKTDVFGDTFD